jgi:hypothetical protein
VTLVEESGGLVHCRFTTSRLKFQLSRRVITCMGPVCCPVGRKQKAEGILGKGRIGQAQIIVKLMF